ncbi:tyrosine-protein kinase receptor torso-like [Pectinophora gossypiella]|uniref:tyrosine-protein kinase receptor torso-like n=1 Tax=Pectinophora gossypiella TaxID=13191 RepID=UPI00214E7034|nr:tyrosine-protein kinase receptor torso-like [Pectinophora gossypiella]
MAVKSNFMTTMCSYKDIIVIVMLSLLCCGDQTLAVEEVAVNLPASVNQTYELANDVCSEFYSAEEVQSCIEKFSSVERNFTFPPPELQYICRNHRQVLYKVAALKVMRMVVLVPQDPNAYIEARLYEDKSEEPVKFSIDNSYNYTAWTTVLHNDATPSMWRRGPDVPSWGEGSEKFEVTLGSSHFNISPNKQRKLDATFQLNLVGDLNSCSVIDIMHVCRSSILGDFFSTTVKAKPNLTITIEDIPIHDNCTLDVRGSADNVLLKTTYQTSFDSPQPNLKADDQHLSVLSQQLPIPVPEAAKNVSLAAEPTANGWDILVSWAPPKRQPDTYNLTLRAPGILRSVILPGNTTQHTFRDVAGDAHALYNVSVAATNPSGKSYNTGRAFFPERRNYQAVIITGSWSIVLTLAIIIIGGIIWWRRRKASELRHLYFQSPQLKLPKECLSESCPESGLEDSWELRSERLLLHEVIGEGAFGVVRKGTLAPGGREVAVKMLKDYPTLEEIRSFRAEMELMKSVGVHPHIVSLVGCCSGRRPLIVAEYCSRGDLLSFLRCSWDVMVSKRNGKYYNNNLEGSEYRNDLFKKPQRDSKLTPLVVNKLYDLQGICDSDLSPLDLLSFCRQIAMGMEFLALNRVVHRDLAARNILVTGDRTLKIADFGLSRDVYQENQYKQKGNGKMPVKWMALESLTHRIYTTQSDVWSFGVVVWEVVTVGGAPYPEVPAARLPRLLKAGYRMPRPNNCSKQLYDLMMSCWRARPRERPTFAELHHKLDELLNNACADEYLSLELDDDPPPTPKPQRYIKMILRGNRVWARGESYERPLKGPQSNHYTSPPAPLAKPQPV